MAARFLSRDERMRSTLQSSLTLEFPPTLLDTPSLICKPLHLLFNGFGFGPGLPRLLKYSQSLPINVAVVPGLALRQVFQNIDYLSPQEIELIHAKY